MLKMILRRKSYLTVCAALMALTALSAACGGAAGRLPPADLMDPAEWLFERGNEHMTETRWFSAREYFRRLVDGYPQSQRREDAKLGIGDSFIGEDSVTSNVLAINEFREFLTFFPVSRRADYAQYRIALAYSRSMLSPQRDQTATKDTIREVELFLQRFPGSEFKDEVQQIEREARDRLSQSEFEIGYFYARFNVCVGAVDRFRGILVSDPAFTNRDAVYFHMAECLLKMGLPAEALPWFERVAVEFEKSEYLERAKRRVAEIKTVPAGRQGGPGGSGGNNRPLTPAR
ncbi:MAG: outer membrane protein assembly factor BamD [Acidimicrobiia bacterium]|nr:outer membrane protein assembly factor BamD [Acidimicrobiia bacterium]